MNLRERNAKVIKHALTESSEVLKLRNFLIKKHGVDPVTDLKNFPISEGRFSWDKLQTKLMEADASGSFTQFLRAGIQQIVNSLYEATETTFEDWVTVTSSSKDTELYAPNHGVSFPRQVGPSEKYPEVGAAALDIQLKNLKFGAIYALEKELMSDDQSGSFSRQAGMLGEYMKILSEVLCYGKLASVANMKYIDYSIPQSETKPSAEANYPYASSAAPMRGGGINRPVAFGSLTQANIVAGLVGQANQKNLQGIKMLVQSKRLVVSHQNKFDAAVLLHSGYYPSGAAAAGAVGGALAINPIQGILDLTASRFMFSNDGTVDGTSKAWYIMDDTKPWFLLQMREPVSIEQEAVNAGASFDIDVVRFKGSSRMNADHIDPRFVWQGNDGSI